MKVNKEKLKKYQDMLEMKRPISRTHPPMGQKKRAAQFSSFAALTGYENAIDETKRNFEKIWDDEYEIKDGKEIAGIKKRTNR